MQRARRVARWLIAGAAAAMSVSAVPATPPQVLFDCRNDDWAVELLGTADKRLILFTTPLKGGGRMGNAASSWDEVREGHVILRPESDAAWVERLGERQWRVHGRKVERAVHLNDVTTPDALSYIDERLAKLGVPRLLSRAGVVDGDVVWIGGFSFDYRRDI